MSFPHYPEYKDSGVEWLGEVPEHWEISALKHQIRMRYGDALASEIREEGDIEVFGSNGPVGSHCVTNTTAPAIVIGRKGSHGKIVWAEQGGFVIDTAYAIDRDTTRLNLRWVYYALQPLGLDSFSQDTGIPGLAREKAYEIRTAFPPPPEQQTIAAFLDREIAKIDALIAEQQRLIELLKEKRQAVISHAVTKGLNPDAPMKDSGIEWLGEVPEHWGVKRLRFIADVQSGIAKGKDNSGHETIEVPYLRVANVQDGFLDLGTVTTIEIPASDLDRYRLRAGDVLMNEGGDYDKLGRGHVWNGEIDPCIHQNHVFAVRPNGVSSEWLNEITGSDYAQFYFMTRSKQSTNLASISSTNIMELPVVLPPDAEQREILFVVSEQRTKFDVLTAEANRAITLLQERRTALISAAVTGKIDVRSALSPLENQPCL